MSRLSAAAVVTAVALLAACAGPDTTGPVVAPASTTSSQVGGADSATATSSCPRGLRRNHHMMPIDTATPSAMNTTGEASANIENAAPVLRMCTMLKNGITGIDSYQSSPRTINCLVI